MIESRVERVDAIESRVERVDKVERVDAIEMSALMRSSPPCQSDRPKRVDAIDSSIYVIDAIESSRLIK